MYKLSLKSAIFTAILLFTSPAFTQEQGSFTDERDGTTYKTVEIGKETWMAENLKYITSEITCGVNTKHGASMKNHGCLYTWEDAQKVCPDGWHLSTKDELKALADLNSSDLRATTWNYGSNSSGFSALPAGSYNINNRYIEFESSCCARFWSDDDNDSSNPSNAYSLYVKYFNDNMSNDCATVGYYDKQDGYSVRCVRNAD